FKGSRYAVRLPIGLPEVIQKAPRDKLYQFYKDWYRPDLMAVIAVGDFDDPAAIEKDIQARFADLHNPAHERARIAARGPAGPGPRADRRRGARRRRHAGVDRDRPRAARDPGLGLQPRAAPPGAVDPRLPADPRRADLSEHPQRAVRGDRPPAGRAVRQRRRG